MSSENKEFTELTDEELFKDIDARSLDSDKISELVSRYMKTVFAYASKYAAFADYEELVSDGMQGLLDAIRGFDLSKGKFSTFVGVCVANRMKNVTKRSINRNSRIADCDNSLKELERIADAAPSPEDVVIQREDDKVFFDNLRQELSELELRCIEGVILGLSYDEIAETLGTEKKAVDNALTRARAKLRRLY